jgi:hypothetical protein
LFIDLINVKAKLLRHHVIQMYGGMEIWSHIFSTPALDGGEWIVYLQEKTQRKQALLVACMDYLLLDIEHGGSIFLQNVCNLLPN